MSDYLDHFDTTDDECEECQGTGYAGDGGVDILEIATWLCSCPAGKRQRQAEQDEFFNQEVKTGPLMPGEFNKPTGETAMTMQDETINVTNLAPQTQAVQISGRKITVNFSRTVQVTQYQPAHASVTTEFEVPDGITDEAMERLILDEFSTVKAAVLQQMGLGFTYDPDERLVMETFPDAQVVAHAPVQPGAGTMFNAPPTSAPAPAAPAGPRAVKRNKTPSATEKPQWDFIVNAMTTGDTSGFWDNRTDKRSPKSPDFKFKNDHPYFPEAALWLNACPDEYMEFFGVVA